MNTNVDICGCCQEIWHPNNLTSIDLGEHKLYLCPDCYKAYMKHAKRMYDAGRKNPSKTFEDWNCQ